MRQSQLFTKTLKNAPSEETATNAKLLTRGGFVYKNSAGVYSYLPLGWRVIGKISKIIREEMNAIGGVEIFMPALVDRKYLEATDRFKLDVGFDVLGKSDKKPPYALGWTHEEVLTAIASKYMSSYKDLPVALYQIQTKFRNETRAKSGLLRGREFLMKDLYSFHASEEDLFAYYEKVKEAYFNVFKRCNLSVLCTVAGGGDFTISNTHEFQVLADAGEDSIFYCAKCCYAENREISEFKKGGKCIKCDGQVLQGNAIEVGNIFPLGAKYSEAFGLKFTDEGGSKKLVVMGSYGIGVSRLMAAVVEIHNDERGIIWPRNVAPYEAHLVYVPSRDPKIKNEADKLYDLLQKEGVEVLYDDRVDVSAGEKFTDADLLGMPLRIVLSERTLAEHCVEFKKRDEQNTELCLLNYSAISQKISA
ncbi:MAG: aminoacyl--tRNA ligase-related protein [Candidatus Spechtbacterales bacterium]